MQQNSSKYGLFSDLLAMAIGQGFKRGLLLLACQCAVVTLSAQFVYFESFQNATAPGWTLTQGNTTPGACLTAGATPQSQDPEAGDPQLDSAGNGWLRLATTTGFQDNAAFLDTSIPSSANEVTISFDFTAWDRSTGTGADGISVFLWDADVVYNEGADGGSLGYAQKTTQSGLNGGYVGVGLDVFGNFSNATEGRTGSDPNMTVGNVSENPGFLANQVVVRGPDDSVAQDGSGNYYYLAGTGGKDYTSVSDTPIQDLVDFNPGNGNLAFPNQDFRPDQDASQYRRFQMTLDGNDILTVSMEFGFGNGLIELYTVDLSTFTRPENLRIGFGGATGGVEQVYEVRNLLVTADGLDDTWYWTDAQLSNDRLWSSATNWTPQSVPGEGANIYADVVFSNQFSTSPLQDATIEVDGGDKTLADIYFSGPYGFTLEAESTQKFIMDTDNSGASEINVLNNPAGNADHAINLDLELQNNLEVNNLVSQTLSLAGDIDSNGNDITVDSSGTTVISGVISEGADLTKEGDGLLTLSGNNTYTGETTIEQGVLEAANANALGATGTGTTVEDGGTLALSGGLSFADESLTLSGTGSDDQGALYNMSGSNTWVASTTLADDASIGAASGSDLTLTGTLDGAGNAITFTPESGGAINVNGLITDSAGTTDVVFAGQGTTEIGYGANNTYSGSTTIRSGTVISNSSVGNFSEEAFGSSNSAIQLGDAQTTASDAIALIFNTSNSGPWQQEVDRAIEINNFGDTTTLGVIGESYLLFENSVNLSKDVTLDTAAGTEMRFNNIANNGQLTGSGDITKTGAGEVQLLGAQSYSGDLNIQEGTVLANGNGSSALDDNGHVTLANTAGATLRVSDDETIGSLAGGGSTGGTVLVDAGQVLSAGNDNTSTTFGGDFDGSGTLRKVGTGTTTFTGNSSATGTLEVQAGTVALGANNIFNDALDLRLSGGTFSTDGFADTFDNLFLDSDSTIDFMGATGGYLTFDDASRNNGILTVDNWAGSLSGNGNTRFQVTASSLGGSLLDSIEFTGWGGADLIDLGGGLYEIVPNLDDFYIWNNDQGNERWNQRQNWEDADGDPVSEDPDFNGAKALISNLDPTLDGNTIDLRTDITLGILVIDNDDTFTISSNNSGHELFFNNNNAEAVISTLGSTAPTIDREIRMEDDLLIQNNSTGTLTFNDSNSGFDIHTNGNTLTFNGAGTTVVNSQIIQGGNVIKTGIGTLELNDNNTFSGGFSQNDGTTLIGNDNALGSGTLTINGGTLAAKGANRTLNESYTVNDDFTVGNDDNRNLTFSGNGTLAAGAQSVTVENGITFTVAGDLTGSGGFVKEGGGTATFSADNSTFSGGLTINEGTAEATVSTGVTLAGTQGNQNYFGSGDVTVNGGNMNITASDSIQVASGGTLRNTGGTLNYVTSNDFDVLGTFDQTGGTTTITSSDDFELGSGANISVSGGALAINATDRFTTNGGNGLISVTNSASMSVDLSAPGGTSNDFFLNQSDTLTVDGNGSSLTITGENNSDIDLEGRVNLSNSGVLEVLAGETNLTDTTILDGGASGTAGTLIVHGDLNIRTPGLANDPNITINADSGNTEIAAISGTESIENIGTLRKTGSGTTTINTSVNNIQADKILIDGGTLLNGDSNQIENETAMELAGATWNTGGYSEVLGTLTLSDNSTINLASGSSIIEFDASASETWANGSELWVTNWSGNINGGGTDQLYFGTSASGLTGSQLGQIVFKNPFGDNLDYGAKMLATGEIVPFQPIPEPSTYAIGASLLALLGWRERKRLQAARRWLAFRRRGKSMEVESPCP